MNKFHDRITLLENLRNLVNAQIVKDRDLLTRENRRDNRKYRNIRDEIIGWMSELQLEEAVKQGQRKLEEQRRKEAEYAATQRANDHQ